MKHSYLIHSAKGTEWKKHKYTKKTADGRYIYNDESYEEAEDEEKELTAEQRKAFVESRKAGNSGSVATQNYRIAQAKAQNAKNKKEAIKEQAEEKDATVSEESKGKGSGSKSKKDPNDPNSKFGKWGKGSNKSSDKKETAKKEKSESTSKEKSTTEKTEKKKEEDVKETEFDRLFKGKSASGSNFNVHKSKTTPNEQTKVNSLVRKAFSASNLKIGDRDTYSVYKLPDNTYRIQVKYENGGSKSMTINNSGSVVNNEHLKHSYNIRRNG